MTAPRYRYCPRCQRRTARSECCGLDLTARRRWRMTPQRIRVVHVLARAVKGLDEETYRLRLQVGADSSRALSREQFRRFIAGLRALPDAGKGARI